MKELLAAKGATPGLVSFEGKERLLGSVSTVLRRVRADQIRREAKVPCGTCTACCKSGYAVDLTPEETKRLPHVLNDCGEPILPRREDGSCTLLKDERCSVYEERPVSCRKYDCRKMSLTGILSKQLMAAGYIPFRVYAKTTEEADVLTAMRLAAADVQAVGAGYGSPEMKAALQSPGICAPGPTAAAEVQTTVEGGGVSAELIASAAGAFWPNYMEKAKKFREMLEANPAIKEELQRAFRDPVGYIGRIDDD
jgi:Fe-S-cluster containining protein